MYGLLINGHLNMLELNQVDKIIEEMKGLGIPRNTIIYTSIIQKCAVTKKVTKMMEVYERMKNERITANMFTYMSIVTGFAKINDIKNARHYAELFSTYIRDKTLLTSLYNVILSAYLFPPNFEAANKLFSELVITFSLFFCFFFALPRMNSIPTSWPFDNSNSVCL